MKFKSCDFCPEKRVQECLKEQHDLLQHLTAALARFHTLATAATKRRKSKHEHEDSFQAATSVANGDVIRSRSLNSYDLQLTYEDTASIIIIRPGKPLQPDQIGHNSMLVAASSMQEEGYAQIAC